MALPCTGSGRSLSLTTPSPTARCRWDTAAVSAEPGLKRMGKCSQAEEGRGLQARGTAVGEDGVKEGSASGDGYTTVRPLAWVTSWMRGCHECGESGSGKTTRAILNH